MFSIIIAILILVAGFIIAPTCFPDKKKRNGDVVKYGNIRTAIRAGALVLALFIIFSSCVITVRTGYTGIVTRFNQVQDYTYEAGLHFKSPFVAIIEMDNREQRVDFQLEAFSKDIQQVDITGSINFNIDKATAMKLYREVGTNYIDTLVRPRVNEDVKIIIAQYTAETLVENRQNASDSIFALLKEELSAKGINVISIAIEDLNFTDGFESSVEAKQIATQEAQRAKTQQEQATMEAEQAAKREKIAAEAKAEVARIEAEAAAYAIQVKADAEAEANKKITTSLTEDLIKYNYVHQWDGKMPTIMSNGSMDLLLNPDNLN